MHGLVFNSWAQNRARVDALPLVPNDLGKVIGFTPQLFQALVHKARPRGVVDAHTVEIP